MKEVRVFNHTDATGVCEPRSHEAGTDASLPHSDEAGEAGRTVRADGDHPGLRWLPGTVSVYIYFPLSSQVSQFR